MTAEANDSEGPVILERFRLLRQLGEGGMGKVYYAEHVHLGSKHAVKALKPMSGLADDLQQQMEARFLREAKVCASVKHPNLVAVTDFGASEGTLYLVMDFIDGEDLQEVIAREGGLSETMSLRILRDVAGAVGALHVKGVIHRDLKPPNVMIENSTGRVVLTDLGIAKDLEGAGTQQMTQGILGTPAYMSPEQMVDTSKTGFESDVYALGATFYAMVACKDPFEGDNPLVVLQTAREQLFAYGSLGGVAANRDKLQMSPPVLELLQDMTRYERKKRLSNCDDVIGRIDAVLTQADSGAWAGTQHVEAGAAARGDRDDMTLFDMDMLEAKQQAGAAPAAPGAPAGQAPGAADAAGGPVGGGLTTGRRPPSSAVGGGGPVGGGLTTGRRPPSSAAGLGTAASLMNKPPPGGATPATIGQDEVQASGEGGAGKGTKNVLAALSGGSAGARRARKSFAAVWVLLLLLAAGGGGGGFYWYQYVYVPSQVKGRASPAPPGPGPDGAREAAATSSGSAATTPTTTPGTGSETGQTESDERVVETSGRPDAGTTTPETAELPFDEVNAPSRLAVPLGGDVTTTLVIVPSGRFKIGSDDKKHKDERPRRVIEFTRPFYVGRFEVTVAEFAAYLGDAKPRNLEEMDLGGMGIEKTRDGYAPQPDMGGFPVRSVSHEDARGFCRWVSKKSGLDIRLLSEVEWEYAARGPESRIYPWGDEWDDALCQSGGRADAVAVGSFPDGATWCGAEDMAGNVFEWTADRYEAGRYRRLPTKDPPVLGKGSSTGVRVIRGGSFGNDKFICRASYRNGITGTASDAALGFRAKARATRDVVKYGVDEKPADNQ